MLDNRLSSFYFFKFFLKKIIRGIFSKNNNYKNKNNIFDSKVIEKKYFKLNKNKNFKNVLLICLDELKYIFFISG